jgi:hypothetical protein
MQLALIPPFSRLSDTYHTKYQLALAHLLQDFEVNSAYCETYLQHSEDSDAYVILDNGAFEGSLVGATDLISLANTYGVNEVVIPDTMKNERETRELARLFQTMAADNLAPGIKLMFVAQGHSQFEMDMSVAWAVNQPWIGTIALPRHTLETCKTLNARLELASWIADNSDKEIHFLGASPLWTTEFIEARNSGIIRGMDTSMPYVYGYHEKVLPSNEILNRPDNYFEVDMDEMQHHITLRNVIMMVDDVYDL